MRYLIITWFYILDFAGGEKEMIRVRLDRELEKKLEKLAYKTHRSKSYYVREALRLYLDEIEDYELALERLHNPWDKVISAEEMWRKNLIHLEGMT